MISTLRSSLVNSELIKNSDCQGHTPLVRVNMFDRDRGEGDLIWVFANRDSFG